MIQRVIVGVFVAAGVLAASAPGATGQLGHNPAPSSALAAEPILHDFGQGSVIASGGGAPSEDGGEGKGKGKGEGKGKGKGKGKSGAGTKESSRSADNRGDDGSGESDSHRSGIDD
ncbi:hypothetical protein [Nocardia goodfellowii]|uniref:Uncharacterized protein n=1 Tax=Nocardia goodfellowii TaxID=882446 RepID=A0ABS4QNF5_9NOCA|nr:hypothetical protein [Nocardia goodfellowii]MBP2193240.1 hypothetical protein [Nocardia goodfellowii]